MLLTQTLLHLNCYHFMQQDVAILGQLDVTWSRHQPAWQNTNLAYLQTGYTFTCCINDVVSLGNTWIEFSSKHKTSIHEWPKIICHHTLFRIRFFHLRSHHNTLISNMKGRMIILLFCFSKVWHYFANFNKKTSCIFTGNYTNFW